ncbi:30S ribosomal protein S10 [Candidatus Vidania fulgoroideorum]
MILKVIFKSYSSYHINKLTCSLKTRFRYWNLVFKGPIFLPKRTMFLNLLRSPHIDKDSRDQFGYSINRAVFYIYSLNDYVIKLLGKIDIPPIIRVYYCFI